MAQMDFEEMQMILQEHRGPQFALKEGQFEAISSVLAGHDTLAVMPTGYGKSLIYECLCLLEPNKVVIVIAPTVALADDIHARLTEQGMAVYRRFQVANDTVENVRSGVVLCAVEHIGYRSFESMQKSLNANGRLKAIVMDEVHVSVQWASFRGCMQNLGLFRVCNVPLLAMSATVPLQMVPQLNALFKVQFNVVRVQNTRPNHRYRVFRTERGQMKPLVIQQVVDALRQNEKSLVFCPTVVQVESMVRAIVLAANRQDVLGAGHVQRYFSALGSDMKKQIVQQFKDGELMVVVSTSAFGVGVDIPDIRYVIHAGPSYTFLDYIQEAGRGGRDGDPTLCMLVDNGLRSHQKEPAKLESLVQYCENNTFCRRQLISLECDDETVETCLEQEVEPCDVCLAGPPQQYEERVGVVPAIVELDPDAYLAAVYSRQEIVRISGSWKMAAFLMQGKCLICLHENQENDTHMDHACPYLAGKCLFCLGQHFVAECPNKPPIRRRDGYLCSKCYVPLRVGSTATHDRDGIEGGCQFFGSRVQQLMLHMQVAPVDEIFKVVDSLPFFYRWYVVEFIGDIDEEDNNN